MRTLALGAVVILCSMMGSLAILAMATPAIETVPVGTIVAWSAGADSVPANWMLCDGKVLRVKQYPELYSVIGPTWGAPSKTKFNLPDLRGRFIRGVDRGAGRDPDVEDRKAANKGGNVKGVGSVQQDSLQNHSHQQDTHTHNYQEYQIGATTSGVALSSFQGGGPYDVILSSWLSASQTSQSSVNIKGAQAFGTKTNVRKGEETRPTNAAVNFIIKVK